MIRTNVLPSGWKIKKKNKKKYCSIKYLIYICKTIKQLKQIIMKVKDFITGLFILLAVGAMLTSCKKEVEDCNCGTVIDSRKSDVYVHIDITIEDECSGNEFKVTTPRSISGKYPRGSYYCNK